MVLTYVIGGLMVMVGALFGSALSPLSMGLCLLMHTLLVCVYFGCVASGFWFSLILFLVFLGGLMILFMYVASLAPNKAYSYMVEWAPAVVIPVGVGVLMLFFADVGVVNLTSSSGHAFWGGLMTLGSGGSSLYGTWSLSSTSYMVVYLLYALLVVVMFSSVGRKAALRSS